MGNLASYIYIIVAIPVYAYKALMAFTLAIIRTSGLAAGDTVQMCYF